MHRDFLQYPSNITQTQIDGSYEDRRAKSLQREYEREREEEVLAIGEMHANMQDRENCFDPDAPRWVEGGYEIAVKPSLSPNRGAIALQQSENSRDVKTKVI